MLIFKQMLGALCPNTPLYVVEGDMNKYVSRKTLPAVLFWMSAVLAASACSPQIRNGFSAKGIISSLALATANNQSSYLYTVGDSVSIAPLVSGETAAPITFAISPALPVGVILNSSTGQISGSASAPQAQTTYVLKTTDSQNNSASLQLTITFYAAPSISVAGSPFTYVEGTAIAPVIPTIGASVSQVTIAPSLPTGLTISSTTGEIQGTPSVASAVTTYTLSAANPAGKIATTTISIQVNAPAAAIAYTGSPFIFTTGDTVSITPTTQIGVITINPALANGLSMDTSGHITGTATGTLALTTYTLTATNGATATTTIQLEIVAPPVIAYTGSPFTLTNGTVASISPTTFTSTVSVSISPSLPTGLAFSTMTGAISSTPTVTSALTTYTITATNLAGQTSTTTIQIQVNDVAPLISYAGSPYVFTTGDSVSITPATTSGTITISPALANGLSMNASGTISGTATGTLAQTTYTLTATNSTSQTTNTTITIQIAAPPAISYAGSPYVVAAGDVVSITPATSVGTITISPALTNSLSMNASGVISGTASGTITSTTYTVTATNAAGATAHTTIVIGPNNPIELVQTAAANNDGTGVITLPGASTAGDFIAVSAWVAVTQLSDLSGINASDSFGNSYAAVPYNTFIDGDGSVTASVILYAKNITVTNSTPITITLNLPAIGSDDMYFEETASEFSGVDPSNPFDQNANNTGAGGASPYSMTTGTTPSTSQGYELLISSIAMDNRTFLDQTVNQTNSPEFNLLSAITNSTQTVAGEARYAITSAVGTYSVVIAASNSDGTGYAGFAGAIATFKGAQTSSGLAAATKIAITSGAQSQVTHACSSIVNVKSETAGGAAANVTSDQTVALSGTGLQFYSDSACTSQISSITFTQGSSTTQSFYFAATTPGTIALTLTPSSFSTVTQNETITLVNFTWIGGGGNSNWSNAANWHGGSAPGNNQIAIFDSNCTSCNATMDSVTANTNITTYSSYTGTITDTAASVQFYNSILGGGTFNGGTGIYAIANTFSVSTPAVFNAQTGTVEVTGNTLFTETGETVTFYNLHLNNQITGPYQNLTLDGNFYVTGTLTLDNVTPTLNNNVGLVKEYGVQYANIYLSGDLTANTGGGGGDGNNDTSNMVTIILNGNNNTQTVTGASAGILPNLTVAHTGTGGVDFVGTIVVGGDFIQTSGAINAGTSTLQIGRGDSARDTGTSLSVSSVTLYNLTINKQAGGVDLGGETLNVANNLTLLSASGMSTFFGDCTNPFTLNLSGDLSIGAGDLAYFCGRPLTFVGTNAQTVTSSGGAFDPGDIEIDKTGGSVTLDSNVAAPNTYMTIQQGTVNLSTYALDLAGFLTLSGASAVLNCDGGCGGIPGSPSPPAMLPNACGLGAGRLQCSALDNSHGGVINP